MDPANTNDAAGRGESALQRGVSRRFGDTMKCHYCPKTTDLKPYGSRGAMVCFRCAMSTPERKAETERNFGLQLDACGPDAVIDGSGAGPYPVKHHPQAAKALRQLREREAG